ncbi:hypothetical protein [Marinobacter salarius]|uniref:hypothetical protein n=1 Tax=Marinobacter salarius TaxID=1420917 RepID=UPI000F84F27D|nr:hypothetical protein [Marinobacter salarius]AZR40948.1 hypothetical protein MTMN5_01497 [Marinobacter salarius]
MNRFSPALVPLLLLLLLAPFAAQAETLTDQTIRSFISSLEALQGMEDEYDDLTDDLAPEEDDGEALDMSRLFSSSVEQMEGHDLYNELEAVVKQHGFSDAEQWGRTGDRIFQAWSAIEMGEQSGQMNQEMAKAMEEINNNPHMSEAQKQQMRDMMGGAMSAMETASNAPEADKRALRPHLDALRAATDSDR